MKFRGRPKRFAMLILQARLTAMEADEAAGGWCGKQFMIQKIRSDICEFVRHARTCHLWERRSRGHVRVRAIRRRRWKAPAGSRSASLERIRPTCSLTELPFAALPLPSLLSSVLPVSAQGKHGRLELTSFAESCHSCSSCRWSMPIALGLRAACTRFAPCYCIPDVTRYFFRRSDQCFNHLEF